LGFLAIVLSAFLTVFIKPKCALVHSTDAAYIHSYWLTEEVMEKRIPRKLKNFKDKKR